MKLIRTDLIERVKAEIKNREDLADKLNAKAEADYQQRLVEHVKVTEPIWREFAKTIGARLRRGEPVMVEDIPRELGRNGYLHGFDRGPGLHTANTQALKTLLTLLEAATDDVITTADVERLGAPMRNLFR